MFVQLVMAAMTTAPSSSASRVAAPRFTCRTAAVGRPAHAPVARSGSAAPNADLARFSGTRSCGRFGPAMLGSTLPRSSSTTSV